MTRLKLGSVDVDLETGDVVRPDGATHLTDLERRFLAYLVDAKGDAVSRESLLRDVWGYAPTVRSKTVETTVQRVRQKIEADPSEPRFFLTAHGRGYRLVVAADVEAPPRTAAAPRGRAEDLARLEAMWRSGSSLMVVAGAPGIGKSRLARSFADGLGTPPRWVDASMARTLSALGVAMANVLGIALDEDLPEQVVLRFLRRPTSALLVLDGADGLDPVELRGFLDPIIALGQRLLLTTRHHESWHDALELGPLSTEVAREWLWQAAGGKDRAGVDGLVGFLGGHPLAIGLAAARLAVLEPSALFDELRQLPARALRGRSEAGRTMAMDAVLEWTWSRVSAGTRRVVAATSLFRRGFDRSDAQWMLSDDRELAESIEAALWHGLVVRDGARYVVPGVVAGFAVGLTDSVSELRYAERVLGSPPAPVPDLYVPERGLGRALDEVEAAFEVVVARRDERLAGNAIATIAGTYAHTGMIPRLEGALRRLEDAGLRPYGGALAALVRAQARFMVGDVAAILTLLGPYADDDTLPRPLAILIEAVRGNAIRYLGDRDRAAPILERAVRWAEELGRPQLLARVLYVMSYLHRNRGDADAYEGTLFRALGLLASEPSPGTEAMLRANIAVSRLERGDRESAVEFMEQAARLSEQYGAQASALLYRGNIAALWIERGDARGEVLLERCIARARELGLARSEMLHTLELGRGLLRTGRVSEARARLAQVVDLAERLHEPPVLARAASELALAEARDGDWLKARQRIEGVLATNLDPLTLAHALQFRARIAVAAGLRADALAALEECRQAVKKMGPHGQLLAEELAETERMVSGLPVPSTE